MKKQLPLLLLIALIALSAACASVSTMQTAQTVPEGELQLALNATATGAKGDAKSHADPNFDAALRYGLTENLDAGLRINLLGAQIGTKYQLVKGKFDLSLGIEAAYQWVWTGGIDKPRSHLFIAQIPLLMEMEINPYIGLAWGVKLLGTYTVKKNKREDIWKNDGLYAGLQLGLPLRLTDKYWLMPEFNIYSNIINNDKKYFDTILWQAGVTIFFNAL